MARSFQLEAWRDRTQLRHDKTDEDWGAVLRERITKAILETLNDPVGASPLTFVENERTTKTELAPIEREGREERHACMARQADFHQGCAT
jgi:hypothetical protein